MIDKKSQTVNIPMDVLEKLKELKERTGVSIRFSVFQALSEYLGKNREKMDENKNN